MKTRYQREVDRKLALLESARMQNASVPTMPFMEVVAAFPELRTIRYVHSSEIRRQLDRPRGHCTWCAGKVPRPRIYWCSDSCVDAFRAVNDVMYQRYLLRLRDDAKCSVCGIVDADWEMDHITPVVLGGGLCGLDNLRTLCVACHKGFTASLNKSLPELKRGTFNA
jgi:5-methylcytosine-specific restriction enzyme A